MPQLFGPTSRPRAGWKVTVCLPVGRAAESPVMSARLQLDEKRPGRGKSSSGPVVFRALYWTFSEKSSTTNEVWSEESSAPTRYTWIVCPLKADTSKVFKL